MRAIIMAAGRGTRISRYIGEMPKCTLEVAGKTIIERSIMSLKKYGVNDIAVVLGYKADSILELIEKYEVEYYINPFFGITNSIASLWFARAFIKEDDQLLLLNGDVYFDEDLLEAVLHETLNPVLFADNNRALCGDYKFMHENNILLKYGKDLTDSESTAEYIGIAKLEGSIIPIFKERLEQFIAEEKFNMWWEDVLYSLTPEENVYVKDIEERFWAEVDYFDDYLRILEHVK